MAETRRSGQSSVRKRTEPMILLCLGLPRTGTMSIRQALRDLGISDVYHFNSLLEDPADCPKWCEAYELKFGKEKGDTPKGLDWNAEQWDQLLGHCMAITDNPCISFYPELIKAYPNAKILLNVRDTPEAWYKSFSSTILPIEETFHHHTNNPFTLLRRFLLQPPSTPFTNLVTHMAHHSPAPSTQFRQHGHELYLSHNESIRSLMRDLDYYPADRFLEYNVKQGWEPLCEFLDREVPRDERTGEVRPFPRLNDTAEFLRLWKRDEEVFYRLPVTRVLGVVGVVGMVGVLGVAVLLGTRNGVGRNLIGKW